MDYLYYLFGTLIFIAVVLLVEGVYLTWNSAKGPEAERVARRLRVMSAGGKGGDQAISIVKERLLSQTPTMQRILLQIPRVGTLDRLLQQSGLSWSVAELLGMSLLAFLVPFFAGGYFAVPLLLRLAVAGAAATLPIFYAMRAKDKRLNRIEQQLPDALDLMGRALRAGHAFPTALKMVGDEMNDPLASEFRAAFDEVNFGIAMPEALMNLATRVPSTDLRYFVIAVLIQRETGGNLSELLANISAIIRDRIKLMGQIRVLSAEGKMSAWVLSLLPFGAALMIQLTNPEFLEVLYTDPAGRKMLAGAAVMMVLGILAMRKIIRIRV
ncbi:type II secretion system F family protein [Noviherbaspirillum sedimenti]|uniref:Pilus assembly protein TadB n=1 Tax=Noviherbaspirillum sedimenti TaxID=2320865 RepID=A0A3A3G5C9_9BURK|nr:type II secretion system F family protein [Noviherbaspirillum sedimenti]RJG03668.1 pilus assembly protein TadB [Noviherbaspirillum sedimenti]